MLPSLFKIKIGTTCQCSVIKRNKFLFIEKKDFLNPRCIYIIVVLYLIKKNTKRDRIDFKSLKITKSLFFRQIKKI